MKDSTAQKAALRISLLYTAVAIRWVLFSDRLLETAVPELGIFAHMQKRPTYSIFRAFLPWYLFLMLMLLLVSCQSNSGNNDLKGRLIVWHSWSPAEVVELEAAFDRFEEIHPDVQIVSVSLPEDLFLEELIKAGQAGLGPSLFIGKDEWISELAESGLIRPLTSGDFSPVFFNKRNRDLTEYKGQTFGVPLSLAPRALFYNKNLVAKPPDTLEALLQEAADGNQVAFVPRFEEAYWGIQTFGEGLFNEPGQLILEESGFEEWLRWLNEAQGAPGVILNVDDQSLLELFTSEQIAYYVAAPGNQELISALIDEENPFEFGVAPLPSGPDGSSGPLLLAETVMFYSFASAEEKEAANELATFLVNQQQSIRFMRELNRVPANPTVRVDPRIYPIVYGFAQQANTAVVIPIELSNDLLITAGNRAYASALSGLFTPAEAVCLFAQEVAAGIEGDAFEIVLPTGCGGSDEQR